MGYDLNRIDNSAIYTHARALSGHSSFRLIGAVDICAERRAIFEHRYGAPAYDRIEIALECLRPDIVVIATSSKSHCSNIKAVVTSHRPQLILCEKPLANKLDEARTIVELCEKAGIDLFVNYIRRTDPGAIEISRRIAVGEIITPVKANVWYSKGVINNGAHFLNLLEWWLGDIESVSVISPGRIWDIDDPEPDFTVNFCNGSAVFRAAWEEAFSFYSIELLSPSGRLKYDRGGEKIAWQSLYTDPNFDGYKILADEEEKIPNSMNIYQSCVYDQVRDHLDGKKTSLCSARQALKTLETIDLVINRR